MKLDHKGAKIYENLGDVPTYDSTPKKVFISQPRYLPNLSYLKKILDSDIFIILDDVQINKRAYQHRNKMVRKGHLPKWLTIPLATGNREEIRSSMIEKTFSFNLHFNTIDNWYKPIKGGYDDTYYLEYMNYLSSILEDDDNHNLGEVLAFGLHRLLTDLGYKGKVVYSSDLSQIINDRLGIIVQGKQKLMLLCREVYGNGLIVGTGAADYGLTANYGNLYNIDVDLRDYEVKGYEGTPEQHLPFAHFELIGENVKDLLENKMINYGIKR